MDYLTLLLHTDALLQWLMEGGYAWLIGGVALIVFMESACIFTPNLPGDSLLFTLGVVLSARAGSISWVLVILVAVAFMGYECNLWVARCLSERTRALCARVAWVARGMEKTTGFLVKQDILALVLARFMPIVRTYVPFMLALGGIHHSRFLIGNLLGALFWVILLTGGGYALGTMPWVHAHYGLVVGLIVVCSLLPLGYTSVRTGIHKLWARCQ